MALSADRTLSIRSGGDALEQSFIVNSGTTVYAGGFYVLLDTGFLGDFADTAGFVPVGFAQNGVVGDGTLECRMTLGEFILEGHAVTGVTAQTDVGRAVFLTDDNTLTLTATTNVGPVGMIVRYLNDGTNVDVLWFSFSTLALADAAQA